MTKRAYPLPGLTQLAAFEAAARHGSFKGAAEELDVTASAISHQIKALEDNLSAHLFLRQNRGVMLSAQGAELFSQLETSFQNISSTCSKIRKEGAQTTVAIAATSVVSTLWLDPRVPIFLKNNRRYRVNQTAARIEDNDLDDLQLRIHYGEPPEGEGEAMPLFHDQLVPVASAEFAKRYNVNSLPALARLPLIKLEIDGQGWTTWSEWFRELGYLGDINYAQKSSNYLEALGIAKSGLGAVLGWQQMLKPQLDRGELVLLTDFSVHAKECFYLQSLPERDLNDAARVMRDWLLSAEQKRLDFS